MQLHATAPFAAPPELRPLAQRVFVALAKARFARESSLLAYGAPWGLRQEHLDTWASAGLLLRGIAIEDPVTDRRTAYAALSTRGAREIGAADAGVVEGMTAARMKRSSQKRLHDLGIGDVVLSAHALADEGKIQLHGVLTDEKKFAVTALVEGEGPSPIRVTLAADAYLVTGSARGAVGLLVEVDRGTISPVRMRDRYAGYLAWKAALGPERNFGIKALRVLTITPDERRLQKLHDAALSANHDHPSGFLVFTTADHATPLHASRLVEPIAKELGRDGLVPVF